MTWAEEFKRLGADGIDFVPFGFNPCCSPQSGIYSSFTKEEMLNGTCYPRTNYLFWKRVNGLKMYLVENKAE